MPEPVVIRPNKDGTFTLFIDHEEGVTGTLEKCQDWADYFSPDYKKPEPCPKESTSASTAAKPTRS